MISRGDYSKVFFYRRWLDEERKGCSFMVRLDRKAKGAEEFTEFILQPVLRVPKNSGAKYYAETMIHFTWCD